MGISIITSDIIEAKYDVFWEDASFVIEDATPKPVLILIDGYERGNTESIQLHKMLDACKLTAEQYNIVQLKNEEQVSWSKLRDALSPGIVLLIGVLPAQLGVHVLFKLNEPNHFNGKIWLPTLSINELEQHPEAKKKLWVSGMKPLFVDKIFEHVPA